MKSKLIACAALAALSGPVHALGTGSLPADVTVFISGAAGLVANFDAVLGIPPTGLTPGTQVCQTDTTTKFVDPVSGTNMIAWFCTASQATGLGGRKILIYFRGSGGSPFGIDPVGQTPIGFYTIGAACPATAGKVTNVCAGWNNKAQGYVETKPEAGFSLMEPRLYLSPSSNIPPAESCANSMFTDPCPPGFGTPGVQSSRSILVQATMIAVNQSLHDKLMVMQKLTGNQVPSLTKAEVRSIFTEGNILSNGAEPPNWSNLSDALVLRGFTGMPFDGQMTICRGINGLGTAAAFNATMLNAPCATGAPQGALTFISTSVPTVAPPLPLQRDLTVDIRQAVGQVLTCIRNAPTPAMGMLTLDQLGALGTNVFYVNIDGHPMINATTIDNAAIQFGLYDMWTETKLQIGFNATGNKLALLQAFQKALQESTPGPGVYNVQGLGESKPMYVTRGGNSCAPPQY